VSLVFLAALGFALGVPVFLTIVLVKYYQVVKKYALDA
jgi:hypothetical protein